MIPKEVTIPGDAFSLQTNHIRESLMNIKSRKVHTGHMYIVTRNYSYRYLFASSNSVLEPVKDIHILTFINEI